MVGAVEPAETAQLQSMTVVARTVKTLLVRRGSMNIDMLAEHAIAPAVHVKIHKVLAECFPGYPDRSYFKQIPHFRYLGWREGELIAHMGVEHRVINQSGTPWNVFGIVDLCVVEPARSQGYAGNLIAELEKLARDSGIHAVVLFADDPRLYLGNGYSQVSNTVKWVMLNEHETIGIAERPVGELMVKTLDGRHWSPDLVDMLGYIF